MKIKNLVVEIYIMLFYDFLLQDYFILFKCIHAKMNGLSSKINFNVFN